MTKDNGKHRESVCASAPSSFFPLSSSCAFVYVNACTYLSHSLSLYPLPSSSCDARVVRVCGWNGQVDRSESEEETAAFFSPSRLPRSPLTDARSRAGRVAIGWKRAGEGKKTEGGSEKKKKEHKTNEENWRRIIHNNSFPLSSLLSGPLFSTKSARFN